MKQRFQDKYKVSKLGRSKITRQVARKKKNSTLRNEERRASMEDGWALVNSHYNCSLNNVKHLKKKLRTYTSESFPLRGQVWSCFLRELACWFNNKTTALHNNENYLEQK